MGKNIIAEKGKLYADFFVSEDGEVFDKKTKSTVYGIGTEREYLNCYVMMKKLNDGYWEIEKVIPRDKEVFGRYGEHTEVLT